MFNSFCHMFAFKFYNKPCNIYNLFSIRSCRSLKLFSQMKRLTPVTVVVFYLTLYICLASRKKHCLITYFGLFANLQIFRLCIKIVFLVSLSLSLSLSLYLYLSLCVSGSSVESVGVCVVKLWGYDHFYFKTKFYFLLSIELFVH